MRTRTIQAPSQNFTAVTMMATIAGQRGAERVDRQAPPVAGRLLAQPVADHPGLADGEVDEHADRVERDEQVGRAPEDDDQPGGQRGQHDDPVRERQAVAAQSELPRHVPVAGQDREQPREGVEAGVGGEEEQQRGECLEQVEQDAVAVDRLGDLRDDRLLLREVDREDREVDGEEGDADEQRRQQGGHHRQGRRRVLRLGRLERRHAGRDRLRAGQGDGAGGECAQDQQDARAARRVACTWLAMVGP